MAILLQIVQGRGPISGAIEFITRSCVYEGTRFRPSHAEFYDDRTNTTLGARWDGVKVRPNRPHEYVEIMRFRVEGIEKAWDWAYSQRGKGYDYLNITGIFFDRDWRDPNRWICSELMAWSFEKAKFPLLNPHIRVSRVEPVHLLLSTRIQRVR